MAQFRASKIVFAPRWRATSNVVNKSIETPTDYVGGRIQIELHLGAFLREVHALITTATVGVCVVEP